MAVKVADLKNKFLNAPFTDSEQKAIQDSETRIDRLLENDYCGFAIRIELGLIEFFSHRRSKKMRDHLISLYDLAGWKVERRSGGDDEDYYLFSEK